MSLTSKLTRLAHYRTHFCNTRTGSVSLINVRNSSGQSLLYREYGEPSKVLLLTNASAREPGDNEVTVKWLLAPVNPADINTIQGKYPSKPMLPAVGGNEGLGEVQKVGRDVTTLQTGDRVVPNGNNLGTWTSCATYNADQLLKVPSGVAKVDACMLNVNPSTAYRMLKDYVELKQGDCVVQNGGNSAVGQFVIQLCKAWNLRNVSVVRDRPNLDRLRSELEQLGCTKVLTEQEFRKTDIFTTGQVPISLLGLNCVGGESALSILRHIGRGGTMVTYGGMSREPVTVPTSALIFKDVTLRGFWMTRWTEANKKSQARENMLESLCKMFEDKKLKAPAHKLVPLSDYREAVEKTLQLDGKTGIKYILDISS